MNLDKKSKIAIIRYKFQLRKTFVKASNIELQICLEELLNEIQKRKLKNVK